MLALVDRPPVELLEKEDEQLKQHSKLVSFLWSHGWFSAAIYVIVVITVVAVIFIYSVSNAKAEKVRNEVREYTLKELRTMEHYGRYPSPFNWKQVSSVAMTMEKCRQAVDNARDSRYPARIVYDEPDKFVYQQYFKTGATLSACQKGQLSVLTSLYNQYREAFS